MIDISSELGRVIRPFRDPSMCANTRLYISLSRRSIEAEIFGTFVPTSTGTFVSPYGGTSTSSTITFGPTSRVFSLSNSTSSTLESTWCVRLHNPSMVRNSGYLVQITQLVNRLENLKSKWMSCILNSLIKSQLPSQQMEEGDTVIHSHP